MGHSLRLHFSTQARQDIATIWDYTFLTYGLDQAERYTDKIEQTCRMLCDMPLIAAEHSAIMPPVRIKVSGGHLIAYEIREDVLFVVRILHTRSDWQVVLSD